MHRRPWAKTYRLVALWVERATCCGYKPGPLQSIATLLEPTRGCRGITHDINEMGRAFFSLDAWKQEVIWLRYTEKDWSRIRRALKLSRRQFESIILELQDTLLDMDPDIYLGEILTEIAERHGGSPPGSP